jgi:polyhydroxyalkanoate synthesis repressor PhaR
MARSARIIKKYANRRLYDTQTSQSITLNDVRDLIGSGELVQVIEAKSGKDVTRSVLLQIVADQELLGRPVLSNEFLESIIRVNSNPMREMARDHLDKVMTHLESQKTSIEEAWAATLKKAGLEDYGTLPLDTVRELQKRMFGLWSDALSPTKRSARDEPDDPPRSR